MSCAMGQLTRDHVVHLETAANLCASRCQENNFLAVKASKRFVCSIFELGGVTKHLMTGPTENSEFYFPSTLGNIEGLGETKLTVYLWAS